MRNKWVIRGGHIITMDDQFGDLPNGAVLVEGDRVTAIAANAEDLDASDAEVIDAGGGIVLPGMIDSHRHMFMALFPGVSADESLLQFLSNTYDRHRNLMEPEDIYIATLVGAIEAMSAGVTTVLDCCEAVGTPQHADAAVRALRESGIRGLYGYGTNPIDYQGRSQGFEDFEGGLKDAERLFIESFRDHEDDIIQMALMMAASGTIPFEQSVAEIKLAEKLGILSASHSGSIKNTIFLKGLREMHDHGYLRRGHVHIHCCGMSDEEWGLIVESGGKVTIAPETEMQMGMGFPPFRAAIDRGLKPGISTDIVNVGSADLFSQMRIGLQMQRALDHEEFHKGGGVPLTVDLGVYEALKWATCNNASVLGLSEKVGTISVGKKADIIILANKGLAASCYPAGTAVLQSGAADVDTVMVNGILRKRDGRIIGHDLEAIREKARRAANRIRTDVVKAPSMSDEAVGQYFQVGERFASINLARAYEKGMPGAEGAKAYTI